MLSFDGTSLEGEQHFALFHETTAPLFDTGLLGDEGAWRCETTDYLVDDLVVSHLRHDGQTLRRTRAQVGEGESDWITLQMYRRGSVRGHVGESSGLALDAGRIGIVDLAQPFTAWTTAVDVIWVGFPRHRIDAAAELAATPSSPTWTRDTMRGHTLAAVVNDLWSRLPETRADEAGELADSITETVNRVLRPDELALDDQALLVAIKDHIAAHLDDLTLDVDALRASFNCSRSALYRVFDQEGGVARHIREQRLLRCFEELARPASLPRRVSEVATRWGFENPSHFHRLFTRTFGLPPSAAERPGGFERGTRRAQPADRGRGPAVPRVGRLPLTVRTGGPRGRWSPAGVRPRLGRMCNAAACPLWFAGYRTPTHQYASTRSEQR